MPQALPPLPFETDALEPLMSKTTLETHHGKHHKTYVEKLNDLIRGTPMAEQPLDEIVKHAEGAIFNNAAQHWNHSFFWQCLTPKQGKPSAATEEVLKNAFGSLEAFNERFTKAAVTHFGSGWAWLVAGRTGALEIIDTHDAACPITEGRTPILVCDVWEHAYYLDHKNLRPKYLESFWKLVNWEFVDKGIAQAAAKVRADNGSQQSAPR